MTRIQVTDEQIRDAQGGDSDAMWAIVESFDHMLRGIVRSVAPNAGQDDAEDLLQDARVALIQRVRSYDSTSSAAELHTYAYLSIRRAVAEEAVKYSTSLSVEPTAVVRVKHALWNAGGDLDAAWAALSEFSDSRKSMSREVFVSVVEALVDSVSLDSPAAGGGDDAPTLTESIPDPDSGFTDSADRRALARWLLSQLAPRQSYALRAFYGIGMQQQTDAETCADMAVKPGTLRETRRRGIETARTISSRHALAA